MITPFEISAPDYAEFGSTETILTLFERQVARCPDAMALAFLRNGETPDRSLTFRQLRQKAVNVAAALLKDHIQAGERVLLAYTEGVEFLPAFLGCLYAGVVAVPVPAPDALRGKRSVPRMQAVSVDAGACRLLTSTDLLERLPEFIAAPIMTTDDLPDDATQEHRFLIPDAVQLAYLQYTSGSTGVPKGVMITHANVVANIRALSCVIGFSSDSVGLTWMPHTHDFGLVEGLLRPLSGGIPNYIMAPGAFIRQPMRWLRAISRFRVTHSSGATFAYQQCVLQAGSVPDDGLDLSSWRVVGVGAEPIRPQSLEDFADTYARFGFRRNTFCPCFGLAEATLMVTASQSRSELITYRGIIGGRETTLMGCGTAWDDVEVKIVDTETRTPLPEGDIGEIWVRGSNVSSGYWQRPVETQEAFGAVLNGATDGLRYLRTGDYGLMRNGVLFVTGRLKDLIIIYGQNYYPSDIEWCLDAAHPAMSEGSKAIYALPASEEGTERLVVVCEIAAKSLQSIDTDAIVAGICAAVANDFQLPVDAIHLIRKGTLPKTPSGKVQRSACRAAIESGELQPLFSWERAGVTDHLPVAEGELRTATQESLAQMWCELLGVDQVGIDDDFFALGGTSLLAARLMEKIGQRFQRQITLEAFAFCPTIAHLAETLDSPYTAPDNTTTLAPAVPEGDSAVAAIAVSPVAVDATNGSLPDGSLTNESLSEEEKTFRRIYEEIALPDAQHQMTDFWYRPPIASRLLRMIVRQRQEVAFPLLKLLVRQRWARRRYWQEEVALISQFHATISTQADREVTINKSLYYGLLNRYGIDLSTSGIPASPRMKVTRLENLELLEEAKARGRGVIIVGHHSLASCWFPKAQQDRLTRRIIFGVNRIPGTEKLDMARYGPILNARQFEVAAQALRRGEVVMVAPDGGVGRAAENSQPFHGKQRSFAEGFAEMAIDTGATVVQLLAEIHPDDDMVIRLVNYLDTGDDAMPRNDRIQLMMNQYRTHLAGVWSRCPWVVFWAGMRFHGLQRDADEK